jgi:LysR family transcriptional activator of nhaA
MKIPDNINLNHLFYFWKVALRGSVTAAAFELGLTQPTLSAQLRALENALGEALFHRIGRELKLTEHGHIALSYSEKIFGLSQELASVFAGQGQLKKGVLRIGVADVVPKNLTYLLIHPILESNPDLRIIFLEDNTEKLLAQMAIRQLDLVIADCPIPPSINVIAYNQLLFRSGISFIASRSLTHGKNVTLHELLQKLPMLLPTQHSNLRIELDRWFHDNEIELSSIHEFQDTALMKVFGAHGEGIYPLPSALESDILKDSSQICLGRIKEPVLNYYLISTERKSKQPFVAAICRQAQKIK